MQLSKLTGSSSRHTAPGRRRQWLGASLMGLALCGAAAAQTAADAPVQAGSAFGIPLFTADPRPSPMGPERMPPALGRHASNGTPMQPVAVNAGPHPVKMPTQRPALLPVKGAGLEVAAFR